MPFPSPGIAVPHPALISSCPTCLRKSVRCPQCGRQSVDDNVGHLPLWCPGCGANLTRGNADGKPSLTDLMGPCFDAGQQTARRYPRLLIAIAVACGLMASYMTAGLVRRDPDLPPPRIVRETYSIQPPYRGWSFDEDRWRIEQSDLALEAKYRGGYGAFFLVHVVRPPGGELTLDEMIHQVKEQWRLQIAGCRFLSDPEPTTVAGQPALRLAALSTPYDKSEPDHFAGDRLRREAIVLMHKGVGYRLTYEDNEASFERMRDTFEKLLASFTLLEKDGEGSSAPERR